MAAEERQERLLRNLDRACIALANSPSTTDSVLLKAIQDVVSLPRLPLTGTTASMAALCLEHLASFVELILHSTADVCPAIFHLIDWLDATTANLHLAPLTCALLSAASPHQLHTVLPSPALDRVEHLLLQQSPHTEWLLACTLHAIDTAFVVPPPPSIELGVQCLLRTTLLGSRINLTAPHVLDVLHAACTAPRVPQRAAASCIALGALQQHPTCTRLTHMVAHSLNAASAGIIATCSGLLAIMPATEPTAMDPRSWYWALALGASDLPRTRSLHAALTGRDAMHVVAHVLFQHALVLPDVDDPSHLAAALMHTPTGPASPNPPAPRLVPLLLAQLRSLPPGDAATAHAHQMLHIVVRTGMLRLWSQHRRLAQGAMQVPLGGVYAQAFSAVVAGLAGLSEGMQRAAQCADEGPLEDAWQPPPPPPPAEDASVAEVLLQGHVQLDRTDSGAHSPGRAARMQHAQLAMAVDTLVVFSCVQVGRQPDATYTALLRTSLHTLSTAGPAQPWALAAYVEHWPSPQSLHQPALHAPEHEAWQTDMLLAARMQFLLGCAPALCTAMPVAALVDVVLPTAACYLHHPHPPLRIAALECCVAVFAALPDDQRVASAAAVTERALAAFPALLDAQALRPLLEAVLKTLPSGAMQSLRCLQLVVQRAQALLHPSHAAVRSSAALGDARPMPDDDRSIASHVGVVLAVCLLVVDYQVWEAALSLVAAGIEQLRGRATVLGAMQAVLVAGDDYTRKLRLARWYNALRSHG